MVKKYSIQPEQVFDTVEKGEFGGELLSTEKLVIFVMTQDWCPQWRDMRRWVYDVQTDATIGVYEIIYNLESYHRTFMRFKENTWGNYEIPYLRFYLNGRLVKESNYINRQTFEKLLNELNNREEVV